jgi:Holliday junction resolvase RusA-like endonuclease
MRVTFNVPGAPQGKGRARVGKVNGHARMFTPQKTVAYEGLIALAAQAAMAGQAPMSGPVAMHVGVRFPIPASWSLRKKAEALSGAVLPTGKPDLDNVIKAVGDACNGIVFGDDSAVVQVIAAKGYSDRPGVTVSVWPHVFQPYDARAF